MKIKGGVCVCRGKQHTDFHMNHLLNKYMHHNVELHEQKKAICTKLITLCSHSTLTISCSSDKGFKTKLKFFYSKLM